MTHKTFYEAAAAEVATGHLDRALWIKVNAEMPGADDSARQAKYIALRAQEMAATDARLRAGAFWQCIPLWVKMTALAVVLLIIVFSIP